MNPFSIPDFQTEAFKSSAMPFNAGIKRVGWLRGR